MTNLIDDIKRDHARPRLTTDWRVFSDVPAPGWVQVIGPAFKVAGPTTATDLNGQDYSDRHRDARRIARVPQMEDALLAAVEALTAIERLYYTEGKDAGYRAAHMNGIARAALEQGNE